MALIHRDNAGRYHVVKSGMVYLGIDTAEDALDAALALDREESTADWTIESGLVCDHLDTLEHPETRIVAQTDLRE